MQNNPQTTIEKYQKIQNQIPQTTKLTIVTKKHSIQTILPLIQLGHTQFAENYVQEAQEKWSQILQTHPEVILKLIGNLQSNKIKIALNLFHEIHTIDSLKIAEKIKKNINPHTKTTTFHAQINIGLEPQKNGINPNDFLEFFVKSPIEISGIMCIPPEGINPTPYFTKMQELSANILTKFNKNIILNMGMSNDFQTAIQNGSNEIRIGSAIFGSR
jgi:pyridoxal phosphate enzyme (YggS family)